MVAEQTADLLSQSNEIVAQAMSLTITDQTSYDAAVGFKKTLADARKRVEGFYEPLKKKAHEAHKAITTQEAEALKPITKAEQILVSSIKTFEAEQERLRREEEARLREEARKREEEERLALAVEVEQSGASQEEVTAVLSAPANVAPVVAAPTFQRQTGAGVRYTWSARVTSLRDLCRAVADGKAPENLVAPNMTALNQMARASQASLQIPGVQAVRV